MQGVLMFRVIKKFWDVFVALLTLLGIYQLPKDLQDAPEASSPWRKLIAMLDQNTALWLFAGIATAYIIWVDIRPFLYQWRDKRWPKPSSPIKVSSHIYIESLHLQGSGQLETLWANDFYLTVENDSEDALVLSGVQCRFNFVDEVTLSTVKETSESSVDIRHGETAMFKIGRLVTMEHLGKVFFSDEKVDPNEQKAFEHNLPKGFLKFEMSSHSKPKSHGLFTSPQKPALWEGVAVVSANNVRSREVIIVIDMANTSNPVSLREVDVTASTRSPLSRGDTVIGRLR